MNIRTDQKYPIELWKGLLKGHPAFILGNGPSIEHEDLSLLDNYFTIGCNRIYMIYDPTIIMWQDREFFADGYDWMGKSSAIKLCRKTIDDKGRWTNFKVESNPYKFHDEPHHLWGFGCTGALAVQLAVAMGCSGIVLLGMDCDYDSPTKTDFYGKNEDHRPHTVRNFHRGMRWVKRECPVPVFNCGPAKYWKRWRLKDVIETMKPKPKPVSRLQWLARLRSESAIKN